MNQAKLFTPEPEIVITIDGGEYKILFDSSRTGIHPPSWYVQNMRTYEVSKRFYSQPGGAANALLTGSIVWEK